MAVEKYYSGNAVQTAFDITFPFLISTDVKAAVGGVTKSTPADYSISGNVVNFTTAPPSGTDNVKIYRNTEIESPRHTYQAGSSIKADALNENNKQLRYKTEEIGFVSVGGSGLGLTAGDKNHITVNSADDWTIDAGTITNNMLSNDSISGTKLTNTSVARSKLENDIIDGTKIEDNAIDSEHYTDKSIDAAHIADNTITTNQLAANSVGNPELKDDAVGIAELSATGTASTATCLRGDNSWATLPTNNNQLTNGASYLSSTGSGANLTDVIHGLSNGLAQTFTSSGTYTAPVQAELFIVICVGGGGGTSYAYSSGRNYGGGAGGTVIGCFDKLAMGATAAVTIGAGGTTETYAGNNVNAGNDDQTNGGTTTFNPVGSGTSVVANGGVTPGMINNGATGSVSAGGGGSGGAVLTGGTAQFLGWVDYGAAGATTRRERPGGAPAIGGTVYGHGAESRTSISAFVDGVTGSPGVCIILAI